MSRSLGHRPYKKSDGFKYYEESHRGHRPAHRKQGAVAWHTLYVLRYPNADVKKAAEEGRKRRPQKIRLQKTSYTYGRGMARSIKAITVCSQEFQGGVRSYERDAALKAVKTANTRKKPEFDRAFDIESYRTRHTALWDAT
jgi:hypothetical protein